MKDWPQVNKKAQAAIKERLDAEINKLQHYYFQEGYNTFSKSRAVEEFFNEYTPQLGALDVDEQKILIKDMLDHIIDRYPIVWDQIQEEAIEDATEIIKKYSLDTDGANEVRNFLINEFGQGIQAYLLDELAGGY